MLLIRVYTVLVSTVQHIKYLLLLLFELTKLAANCGDKGRKLMLH